MNPGPELNRLIAVKVMGKHKFIPNTDEHKYNCKECGRLELSEPHEVLPYSTDISAAWEIVEKIRPEKLVCIRPWGDNFHVEICDVSLNVTANAHHAKAAAAICLAALKAVGHEFEEIAKS